MQEVLKIRNLGPIKDTKIEPRPLTVIIGPQASGKSLITQCLYTFRGFEAQAAEKFDTIDLKKKNWPDDLARAIFDDLRNTPFGYFANGTAYLNYETIKPKRDWSVHVHGSNRIVSPKKGLLNEIKKWFGAWANNKMLLGVTDKSHNIYIPPERSIYTRTAFKSTAMLFDEKTQPEPFRNFSNILFRSVDEYTEKYYAKRNPANGTTDIYQYIMECQRNALSGEAYVPRHGPRQWKWKVIESKEGENDQKKAKIIPLEGTSSGQMESWPFFAIAATVGAKNPNVNIYFEEPETHLHPAAQIEVMNAVAHLVNHGRNVVITTHSPFLLYVINIMIMRYIAYKNESKNSLNPDDVVAYRLEDGMAKPILDRDITKLISEEELDRVASQLGAEFDKLSDLIEFLG